MDLLYHSKGLTLSSLGTKGMKDQTRFVCKQFELLLLLLLLDGLCHSLKQACFTLGVSFVPDASSVTLTQGKILCVNSSRTNVKCLDVTRDASGVTSFEAK